MKITSQEARRVAALASLEFDESGLERMAEEMSRILDYVDQIKATDVTTLPVDLPGAPVANRRDEVCASETGAATKANAPSMLHGHFVVPKVIGEE